MSDTENPIQEWLARVAIECGNPDKMETWGIMMQNDNTKRLIVGYALAWRTRLYHGTGPRERVNGSGKA